MILRKKQIDFSSDSILVCGRKPLDFSEVINKGHIVICFEAKNYSDFCSCYSDGRFYVNKMGQKYTIKAKTEINKRA